MSRPMLGNATAIIVLPRGASDAASIMPASADTGSPCGRSVVVVLTGCG